MFFPVVAAWVKQAHFHTRIGIDSGYTIRLFEITARARLGQVVQIIRASQRERYDVFDMKGSALQ
jgi:hypothetical protein